jgi:hypothetical protein
MVCAFTPALLLESLTDTAFACNGRSSTVSSWIVAIKTGDNEWQVQTSLPVQGRWMLGLGILISDTDKVDVEAPILIK